VLLRVDDARAGRELVIDADLLAFITQ